MAIVPDSTSFRTYVAGYFADGPLVERLSISAFGGSLAVSAPDVQAPVALPWVRAWASRSRVIVSFERPLEAIGQVTTFDVAGRLVHRVALPAGTSRHVVGDLSSGVYFVRAESAGRRGSARAVVVQ